jgi:hypothetical protein
VSGPSLGPTQPPIQWLSGALTSEVKRPGREADQSPPSSADVKNTWSCASTTSYIFMAWYLAKNRETLPLPQTLGRNFGWGIGPYVHAANHFLVFEWFGQCAAETTVIGCFTLSFWTVSFVSRKDCKLDCFLQHSFRFEIGHSHQWLRLFLKLPNRAKLQLH